MVGLCVKFGPTLGLDTSEGTSYPDTEGIKFGLSMGKVFTSSSSAEGGATIGETVVKLSGPRIGAIVF